MKVGELARRTGLTVRTLHHYDAIGLLRPSLHTGSGHRLYTEADVARLQQICSLRQLGFALEEVRDCLDRPGFSPVEVVRLHLARLREQIALQQQLCDRLEGLARLFATAEEVSAETFLQTIEVMTMIEKYYTPEQQEYLAKRREEVGDEAIQQAQRDWTDLFAAFRAAWEKGTPVTDPAVQALADKYQGLIAAFTGGNAGVEQSLNRLWTEQGDALRAKHGYDHPPGMQEYIQQALASRKGTG